MSIKTIKNANGQVMARYVVDENDKKNGLYEEYNENGKCVRSGIYKNDKPFSGEFSGTHSNGKKWVGSYENGLKTGPWEEEEDGEIWHGKYIDGLKEGTWEMHSNEYCPNADYTNFIRTYQHGILEGPYCEPFRQRMKHEPDGILYLEDADINKCEFEEGTYHNGKREGSFLRENVLIDIHFYENSNPTEEWGYIEGEYQDGRVIHSALYNRYKYAGQDFIKDPRYNDKGHVEVAKARVAYDGDGNSTTWYYNNKTGSNGHLKNGIKEGLWYDVIAFRHYSCEKPAKLRMLGNYVNGKKMGKWEVPFDQFYITYQNGQPNGPFRMRTYIGDVCIGQMKDGDYDGVCKILNQEENSKMTELYENGKLLESTKYHDDQKVVHSKLCPEIGNNYLYEKFEKGKLAETYFLYGPTPDYSRVPDTKHVYYNTDGSVRQVCYTTQYGQEISEQEWLAKQQWLAKQRRKHRDKFKAQLAERAFEKRADEEARDQTAQEIKKIRSNIGTATTKMARSLLQHSAKKVAEEFHTQKANVPRRTALKFKTGKEDR